MPGAAPAVREQRQASEPALRLQPAPAPPPPQKLSPGLSLASGVQAKRFVSSPGDAAEREADTVARQVMTMPAPASTGMSRTALHAQRAPAVTAAQPARATTAAANDRALETQVKAASTGGMELSRKTRAFLEPRFRADFSAVRVHADPGAVRLSNQIGARAFTYGRHIFFNSGQYDPESRDGLELLAHELTHTIQQSETIQRKAAEPEVPPVRERTGPQASRLGISDVLDYFADAANAIPGYRMFTILIGVNPINMSSVEASAANILRAIVEFLPGGNVITRVLDSYGVFEKVGGWIEGQLKSLGISGASIRAAVNRFIDSLGWRDIFRLGSVWNRAKAIFTDPISRILAFARSLFGKILDFVREAVLRPLAALAENTPFYPLLKAVLGKDPVTGEPVQGGASEVIGGFMTMIGQQELWGNIQRANAIPRAWAWFQTAMKGLLGIVTSIPARFMGLLGSLEIMDFVVLPRAFAKIGGVLASFLSDFGSWALGTIFDLLKIIMEVVAPGVMPYIYRAGAAFRTIIRDPVRFIRTLVAAAMKSFRQFAANFLTHLQASLVGWLTGAMAGANIYIPQGLNLREILKFVLSILGLTWQNIRAKLVRATNETTVVALETGFDIVLTLVRDGPAAAWQKILETLSNLKQMAIDAIMDFVKSRVVEAAVTRLLSMLSPAGALIQAIIAIYNTIMFFVERLRQIAAVAASFIDALATIAAGNIGPAANRVETTMAGLLTLVISFLARIAGLGRVADAVTGLIARIRAPIDRALDRVVDWIVTQARRLGAAVMRGARGAVARVVNWWRQRRAIPLADGRTHNLYFRGEGTSAQLVMASVEKPISQHLADVVAWRDADAATKARASSARDFSIRVLEPVIAAGATPTPAQQAAMDALDGNMTQCAGMLRVIVIPDSGTMPPAELTFGGPYRATAEKLSNRTSRGGEDSRAGDPPGWNLITQYGLTRRNGNWVRMHMISAAFGGLDVNPNLVPSPTAVNSAANRALEQPVERVLYGDERAEDVRAVPTLLAGLSNRRGMVWVETTTGGFHPAVAATPASPAIPANSFASSITLRFGSFTKSGNSWTRNAAPTATFSSPITAPNFTGAYVPSINDVGSTTIDQIAHIGMHFAGEIVRVRNSTGRFNSPTGFRDAMHRSRRNEMEITPEFRAAVNAVVAALNSNLLAL